MTKSKKTSKTRQKFDFGTEPKVTTLLPTCFWITAMHSVCCCSLLVWRRSSLKKGTPSDLFLPRPGSTPGRIWPKNNNTCKGPCVLHPYQVSSKSIKRFWRRSRKCEKLTPDGWTDYGRCAMTIAHSSLRLRWAKNLREDLGYLLLVKFRWNPLLILEKKLKMLKVYGRTPDINDHNIYLQPLDQVHLK